MNNNIIHQIELVLLDKKVIYPINEGRDLFLEPKFIKIFTQSVGILKQKEYYKKYNIEDTALLYSLKSYMKNINNDLLIKYYNYIKQKFFSSEKWQKIKKTIGL
jgi:hypothetical protein